MKKKSEKSQGTELLESRVFHSKLKKLLQKSGDPDLTELAPHISKGVELVDSIFKALSAAETVKLPRGIRVSAIEVAPIKPTDEKAAGIILAANWLVELIKKEIGYEDCGYED